MVIENNVDRRYRVTIETNGLNLVMRLPANTLHTHAMVVVNIDMDEWQRWISQWLDSYQTVIVLDQDYQLIYGDSMKAELCKALGNKGEHSGIKKCNDTSYGIAEAQSNVLGWHYYVLTDVEMGQS